MDIGCSIKKFRHFALHIDEASVDNSNLAFSRIVDVVVRTLQPIYGIGYSMPYFWGPQAFAIGQTVSRHATADGSFHGALEEIRRQSRAFSRTFLADAPERGLDVRLRDVFELNFLSEGHLNQKIEGLMLGAFIEKYGVGTLDQLTPVMWRWRVPRSEVQNVRKATKNADFIVVKE
ncbi:hypothetical protein I6F15_08700 [Bradyrhizobium sp. BRP14]|nr:hypothetical protein [Bradyrhizobium sp. BRP14]